LIGKIFSPAMISIAIDLPLFSGPLKNDYLIELTPYPRQLLRRKAEDRILPRPFDRQIGEASYAHAVMKPPLYGGSDSPLYGGSDQIRREERERDRHIHLAGAAALSFCDAFAGCRWIPDEFIEPTTSTGDRRD
jgi:hypothetical protein